MAATVDMTRFHQAVKRMMEVPSKTGSVVLNKSVLQIAVGSGSGKGLVHFTKKATEAQIRQDMSQMVTSVGKRGGTHSAPRIVLIATRNLIARGRRPYGWGIDEQLRWRSEVSQECEKIMKRRVSSRAYIAAGWLWAARDLAKNVPGHTLTRLEPKNLPTKAGASASMSFAAPATGGSLVCALFNTSRGADKVVTAGMIQLAVNSEVNNLTKYFQNEMTKAIMRAVGRSQYALAA